MWIQDARVRDQMVCGEKIERKKQVKVQEGKRNNIASTHACNYERDHHLESGPDTRCDEFLVCDQDPT